MIPELPKGTADTIIFDAIGAKGRNLVLVTATTRFAGALTNSPASSRPRFVP